MRLYALNYCSTEEMEAELDDPSMGANLKEWATPQVVAIATDRTLEAQVEYVKGLVESDRKHLDPDDEELASEEYVWLEEAWETPEKGRPSRTLTMYLKETGDSLEATSYALAEPIAVVVIQLVEEEGLTL